jgi:hypothetical protein
MPVGYHRNVLAASPTGSLAPSHPQATRRPGGSGPAETSLTRSRRVRRSCLDSHQRAISPYVAASSKILPKAVSGSDRAVTTASRAATVAVQRQNEHQHEKEKYVQGHSPRAR